MKTPMLLTTLLSFTQLFLLVTITITILLPLASADLVDDTCKKTPFPDFCVSVLRADPRSSAADTKTLGLIVLDKVDANAKSTLTKIADLLGKSPDPKTKQALTSCQQSYQTIETALVPSSKQSLTTGDYKFAEQYMTATATDASTCEAGFGGKSPLSDSNDYENKAASVTSAIASQLL